jgi:hypothetical protein
LPTLGLKKT